MMITIVGNGSGETVYENKAIKVSDGVSIEEMQAWADQWRQELDDDKLDQFSDLDTDVVTIEEVVAAMPAEWQAELTEDTCDIVFL